MDKRILNVAMAVLLSISMAACSSSTGSNAQAGNTSETASTTAPSSSGAVTASAMSALASDSASDSSSSDSAADSNSDSVSDSDSSTDSAADTTTVDTISVSEPKVFSSTAKASDTTSYLYKYLNDSAGLTSAMTSAQAQTSTSCTNSATSYDGACRKATVAAGTVMLKNEQTYSSYAVIREETTESDPLNSYVALVTTGTPEANKSSALNASYAGKAAYSLNNAAAVTSANFTMDVSDSGGITGTVYTGGTGSAKVNNFATFDNGSVNVTNGYVTFNGDASFKISTSVTESGSYSGYFAGENAEEVVGTFETDSGASKTVQGAFAGIKQ